MPGNFQVIISLRVWLQLGSRNVLLDDSLPAGCCVSEHLQHSDLSMSCPVCMDIVNTNCPSRDMAASNVGHVSMVFLMHACAVTLVQHTAYIHIQGKMLVLPKKFPPFSQSITCTLLVSPCSLAVTFGVNHLQCPGTCTCTLTSL